MNTVDAIAIAFILGVFLYLFGNLAYGYRRAIKLYEGDEEQ
jgi:uncharacterized protein YpmB